MSSGPVLRTERLVLDPFVPAQVDDLLQLFRTPEVRRYLLDDELVDREWVEAEVEASAGNFARDGYGLWAVRRDAGGDLIGFSGYRFFHDPPELQLVCGFDPRYWGRGIATEACREVIRYGFEVLGFERIAADADAPNEGSVRLMDRLGMRFLTRTEKGGQDTVSYVLERRSGEVHAKESSRVGPAEAPELASPPEPPYYAAIFTSQRAEGGDDDYDRMARRMFELASEQPGFLGVDSVRNGSLGITVSYWSSEEAILDWKAHLEHREAQRQGRGKWYASYSVRIARVDRAYGHGGP